MNTTTLPESKTYTVTIDNGKHKLMGTFPMPDRLPQVGDVYETTEPFVTLAKLAYNIGDRFEVIERTQMNKHGRLSSIGNLLIRDRFTTSVWTEFDAGVARGQFKLVESKP